MAKVQFVGLASCAHVGWKGAEAFACRPFRANARAPLPQPRGPGKLHPEFRMKWGTHVRSVAGRQAVLGGKTPCEALREVRAQEWPRRMRQLPGQREGMMKQKGADVSFPRAKNLKSELYRSEEGSMGTWGVVASK